MFFFLSLSLSPSLSLSLSLKLLFFEKKIVEKFTTLSELGLGKLLSAYTVYTVYLNVGRGGGRRGVGHLNIFVYCILESYTAYISVRKLNLSPLEFAASSGYSQN